MDFFRTITGQRAPSVSVGTDEIDEVLADVDEPPEEHHIARLEPKYTKAKPPPMPERRESLLTRQLHSENEHTDEDVPHPSRTLSTQSHSTWSTYSTASTAELTSDDGRSVPSPAVSPPLPATYVRTPLPISEMSLSREIQIVGHEGAVAMKDPEETVSEKTIEANLGRKRCISFACGRKVAEQPKASSPPPTLRPKDESAYQAASPPKRKCALTFACPSKSASAVKPNKRAVSPPPPKSETQNKAATVKVHRDSDSTVTLTSPKGIRRTAPTSSSNSAPAATEILTTIQKVSIDSDGSDTEATRFHAFGTEQDEQEEWVQESTCHRSRLTINDTLQKENVIRKACEEVDEEVIEEEGEDEDEIAVADTETLDVEDADEEQDEDNDDDGEESEPSDDGFHSDDEEGFAASDSEGEDSENEWWRPGGQSTAATSVEHLDRITMQRPEHTTDPSSSLGSVSSGQSLPRASRHHRFHRNARKARDADAVPINRAPTPSLPDSTDFVCGTLDEDRPLEQAYLNCIKTREAAKHKVRPQDIDPTFPTSDPEMDEEDDEDLVDPEESEHEDLMHGNMDDIDELDVPTPVTRRPSLAPMRKGTARSPPPPPRHHSPPPKRRAHPSPPPQGKRAAAKSSPPHKLFGRSPALKRAPAPGKKPITRPRASPNEFPVINAVGPFCLAQRTHLTHTASLPRAPGMFLSRMHGPDEVGGSDTPGTDAPKRGAIDIVKGLEKKRQRRKEKLYQKACAKAATKAEKTFKVKPGRGAERMRELGLELQRYHGKGEFILSA